MLSRLSIRSRITLGSLAVAVVLLLAALLVVRAQVSTVLASADASLAQSDLESFEKDVTANPDETVDEPGSGILVYVRSPDGTVQANTLPRDILEQILGRDATDEQYMTTDDEERTFVVVGRAVQTSAGTWAMWSARSTSSNEVALRGLDGVLVVGGLVLLLGFGAASWLLATAALRPVSAMRRRAEQLGEGATDTQLPVGRTQDELSELATTLNSFLSRVQAASAREKQMVSDAAHELRTPLAVLRTQLELAHNDFGDADALARQVRAAEVSVDRLASLASNLLELSRIESHEAAVSTATATALTDEFMGSVDRARMLALPKSVSVEFSLSPVDDDAEYRIGAQAFGRLVDNLLTNAINAVPNAGTVNATLGQADGRLRLAVSDDGPGMPDDFVPVAFERFTRPDASRATSTGGSGLGLALVRALAREAGGEAMAENTHPGLRMTVSLPKM
ncbi:signal transduction histidine kinase [Salinibacterium sp. CAN_S4]|uniref:sensor histidine kinase n=1 Tax=Salinibacterium sp. CAN_S4 TaxID=2787727 RepID=UPI0018F0582C